MIWMKILFLPNQTKRQPEKSQKPAKHHSYKSSKCISKFRYGVCCGQMAQRWSVFEYIVSREPKKLQTNIVKWKPLYTFLAQKTKSGEQFFRRSVYSYWCNQCKVTIYAIQTTITTRSWKMIPRERIPATKCSLICLTRCSDEHHGAPTAFVQPGSIHA